MYKHQYLAYGKIRHSDKVRSRHLQYCWTNYFSKAAIENVAVVEGKYDRIDHFTFLMYVICDVVFVVNGYRHNQKYCVQGYYKSNGRSDFFSDVGIYTGKYIRCKNPLDEFLVPILSKRDFDKVAEQIVKEYYPYEANFPCRINGIVLAEAMGYGVRYAKLSLNGKVKSKIIFEKKDVTVYDKEGHKKLLSVEKPTIFVDESLKNIVDEHNAVIHECVHAYGNFHNDFIRNRVTLIGCPKLDEGSYADKLTSIIKQNDIRSITVARMEVPCCGGIQNAVNIALQNSSKNIPLKVIIIGTSGNIIN